VAGVTLNEGFLVWLRKCHPSVEMFVAFLRALISQIVERAQIQDPWKCLQFLAVSPSKWLCRYFPTFFLFLLLGLWL